MLKFEKGFFDLVGKMSNEQIHEMCSNVVDGLNQKQKEASKETTNVKTETTEIR